MNRPLRKLLPGFCFLALFAATTAAKATIWTVNSTADPDTGSGTSGSLRFCINNAAAGDTIVFINSVMWTITLSSALPTISEPAVGNQPGLTIQGPVAGSVTISGANTCQVFNIASGATASISGLTIANGYATGVNGGGAILNNGTLTVTSGTFSDNTAAEGGGAILNNGDLTLTSCTFTNNIVATNGGAIQNDGNLTVTSGTFSHNTATYGGGAILNNGTLAVTAGTFTGNSTPGVGGAIVNVHISTLSLVACTFAYNTAGGNVGWGGAIYNQSDSILAVTATNSTFTGNSASVSGGAIYNQGAVTLISCTISGNNADYGGGIENGGTLTIANSTVSGNSASNGGGIFNYGYADFDTASVEIVNSTLSGNSATNGGGIFNDLGAFGGSATLEIGSTILQAGASGVNITNASGTVTSDGYNLSSDDGGGILTATGDLINTDPMLGPLQDNGGPTFTHALLCGSPAIDQGKNFSGSAYDQRGAGFARTVDDPCVPNAAGSDGTDVGAFEVQQPDAIECCIAQLVPCAGPLSGGTWKNHGQYVSSVAHAADQPRQAGLVSQAQEGAIISQAAQSNCGKK